MQVADNTMENLIAMRLEDMAARYEEHARNGDTELALLIRQEGLALAQAFDTKETILIAEALF